MVCIQYPTLLFPLGECVDLTISTRKGGFKKITMLLTTGIEPVPPEGDKNLNLTP